MTTKKPPRKLVINEILGAGHFAEVRSGKDPIHGDVAVKILKRISGETDFSWKARQNLVLKEGKLQSNATHENIVRVHYTKTHSQIPILVMELCRGGSLLEKYETGPLPLPEVRRLLTDATTGLCTLHSRGMLHRDIKPSNILIDDSRGRAKLGDFGLVTDEFILGYASDRGYQDHLALEVFQGKGTSFKTDIWAMGMTAYRLLHGKAWYDMTVGQARYSIPNGGFAKKLRWLPHIPDSWQRFVRKSMNDAPERRFLTAQAMLDGLARLNITPAWDCTVSNVATWSLEKADIRHEVQWNLNHKTPAWSARTINLETGKERKLKTTGNLDDLRSYLLGR
ncbi:serine/threonine-protein kinase [Myxococcus faecalis]|uniref:serine/threonine-protein kinase n=1 Tax=Myxococcus faecalis TaxID=3115646 RepID=UPI0038D13516